MYAVGMYSPISTDKFRISTLFLFQLSDEWFRLLLEVPRSDHDGGFGL